MIRSRVFLSSKYRIIGHPIEPCLGNHRLSFGQSRITINTRKFHSCCLLLNTEKRRFDLKEKNVAAADDASRNKTHERFLERVTEFVESLDKRRNGAGSSDSSPKSSKTTASDKLSTEAEKPEIFWLYPFLCNVFLKLQDMRPESPVNRHRILEGAEAAFACLWKVANSSDPNDVSVFKGAVVEELYKNHTEAKAKLFAPSNAKLSNIDSVEIKRIGFEKLVLMKKNRSESVRVFVEVAYKYEVELPIDDISVRRKRAEAVWTFQGWFNFLAPPQDDDDAQFVVFDMK